MTQIARAVVPFWFYGTLCMAALLAASVVSYRLISHTERDWVQLDQQGTGTWAGNKLVVPRLFDRRTGELCEYRGQDSKADLASQIVRGPWICYPGPASK